MKSRVDYEREEAVGRGAVPCLAADLPGIEFVGHTHAPAVNSILCSPRAREFAVKRIFPDEIVCCDVASVFVPYTDPGLKLAQAIRIKTEEFIRTSAVRRA